jgi:hypothetical protein
MVARPALPSGMGLGVAAPGVVVVDYAQSLETSSEKFMQTIEQATPEQLAKRKANLERKQRQRAREKARSFQAMQDHLERIKADRMNAEGIARRTKRNQCMFGEVRPGVDAKTIDEALEVAREMARALDCPDVQENESLYDFERRIFDAWVNFDKFVGHNDAGGRSPFAGGGHAPYSNRETGELFPGRGKDYWIDHCGGFDECWQALPGAKKILDLATLPKLKKIKKTDESKPELKAMPAPAPSAPIPQQQPDSINFAWIRRKRSDIYITAEFNRRFKQATHKEKSWKSCNKRNC